MSASAPRRMYRLFDFIPHVVSRISVVVGVLVLIGWKFDVPPLKSIFSGLTIMKVNTAVGFILAGVALWSNAMDTHSRALHIVAQVCASVISLLGLATLFESLSGVNFGIDQFLVREITHIPGDIPGRMALNSALSFAAVGSALLLMSLRRRRFIVAIHALVLVLLITAGSALIGYAYDIAGFLREKLDYTPMALHTAIVFVLLALGVMTARADYPLRRYLGSTSSAGVMVRQLLPAAIVLTLLTGWLILRGFHAGHFGATFALALFTAVNIIWLGGLILWGARTFYHAAVQRERLEESLRSASRYVRSLIEASLDPLVTINIEGKISDVNEATVKATGVTRAALIGSDFSNYFTEPNKARAGYKEVFAKGFVMGYPLALRQASGSAIDVLYNASVFRNEKGEVAGVFAAARDVTERNKLERELERQAHIDLLTDLNTRRHFMELAGHEFARFRRHNEPLSLLMMDLDRFKVVNDTYGHDAGDAVLQRFGEVCRHTFRDIDIVGRVGGEEFAALLPETNMKQAVNVAERLCQAVESSEVKLDDGSLIHFTVSVGVTSFGATDEKIGRVLKRADVALYKAKNAGRNRVCAEGADGNDKNE